MTAHTCGGVITYRLVLDDDGNAVILRWCATCEIAPDDLGPIDLADVPGELLAALLLAAHPESEQ